MKKIRRRLIVLLVLIDLVVLGAVGAWVWKRALRDDFEWDPAKRPSAVVGQRWYEELRRVIRRAAKDVKAPFRPGRDDELTEFGYRGVHEVSEVTSMGRVGKKRVTMEGWRELLRDGNTEQCLEGKTVLVDATTDPPTWTIEGPKLELTQSAIGFLEHLARATRDGVDTAQGDLDEFLPRSPVKQGATWPIELDPVVEAVFSGTAPVASDGARASGRLTSVRVEDGVHMGHIDATVDVRLRQVPNEPMQYVQGGLARIHIVIDRSLEPEKRDVRHSSLELLLAGIASAERQEGTFLAQVEIVQSEERKRGPLEPARK